MLKQALLRRIARVGIVTVLFMQLALTAYACPLFPDAHDETSAMAVADMSTGMPGCHEDESDTDDAALCLQHCQAGNDSVQNTPQSPLPAVTAPAPALKALFQPECGQGLALSYDLMQRVNSPPPSLLYCVFRI